MNIFASNLTLFMKISLECFEFGLSVTLQIDLINLNKRLSFKALTEFSSVNLFE